METHFVWSIKKSDSFVYIIVANCMFFQKIHFDRFLWVPLNLFSNLTFYLKHTYVFSFISSFQIQRLICNMINIYNIYNICTIIRFIKYIIYIQMYHPISIWLTLLHMYIYKIYTLYIKLLQSLILWEMYKYWY